MDLWSLSDLSTPWALRVVVTLRIAERLAEGPAQVGELARAAGCDAAYLRRTLTHLASKGVFDEPEPGTFALNDAARGLLDEPLRLFLDLDGVGGRLAGAWAAFLPAVRRGEPAYRELYGMTFWDDLEAHPRLSESFDALMGPAGHGDFDPEILVGGDWDGVSEVVDVGGGTGAALAAILRARPGVRGTLVELPATAARAAESFAAAELAERATVIPGSFYDSLPAGKDVYLVRKVLNDLPDREALALLRGCAQAAGVSGRVVVVGSVSLEPIARGGLTPELVLVGGTERTLEDFRELAGQAGLVVSATGEQRSGRTVVECRPESPGRRAGGLPRV
ncbi:methyltransferase [Nonomuraea sp. NPDC049784]|uniref:methyltransferase n=1 Tax=Nonomuraea sp. NPDC049784 TaxID=3154361 RepID=UPI0033ECACC3